MAKWWQLYKIEWRNNAFFYLVISLLVVGWYLFIGVQAWPEFLILGLSLLPFCLLPGVILWLGFQSFRQEWKQETIYALLSLPRTGWELTGSKFLSGISFYLLLTLLAGGLSILINWGFVIELGSQLSGLQWIVNNLIKLVILCWLISAGLYITSQFSYLVSRIFDCWQGLISIFTFFLTQYLVVRGGSLTAGLFGWLPRILLEGKVFTSGLVAEQTFQLNPAPIAGSLLVVGVIFGFSSWLIETQLEI